jgi:4-amino-4-deoxy-L-arabinose transferase-like glycosyltransferase
MNEDNNKPNVFPISTTVISNCLLSGYIKYLLVGPLALLVIVIIILSYVPPVSRDALTHHLVVPKLYLQHGGIYEIPSIVFSYYPMNLDLLYMIPLYFGNDIAPKYIHFLFALLTAVLIFYYLRKRLGHQWGLFGALFFLSLPLIVKLSITIYVDLGLIFFSTAALVSLLKWIEYRLKLKFLILSAICCGLALGTKYNGLIVLFLLTIFIPFIYISYLKNDSNNNTSANRATPIRLQLKAVGFGVLFAALALLVFSPWMIRNYVWKTNPIYPLYDNLFNRAIPVSPTTQSDNQALEPDSVPQQTAKAETSRWSSFAIRKVIYGESWWEIALIPVRIFFQGQDDNPKYFDGKLNPFLFFLPFFAFIHLNKDSAPLRSEKKIFIFFAILFLLYAFSMSSIRIRYVAPIIPPLVILATLGLHRLTTMVTNRTKIQSAWVRSGFVMVMITIILALNASYIWKQFRYVDPLSYISGRISRDAYIAKYRPEYSIYQYVNRHLPDNAKLLGLFLGNRRYYSERDLIFGVSEFKKIVNSADSEKKFLKELREKGFTHLIIRFDLFNQWTNNQFDNRKRELLKLFFAGHVRPILSKDGYELFELIG